MKSKAHKSNAERSADKWFVYLVQCADDSLYTGIAKDLVRRIHQHNSGTASKYTRSRLPVKLVYHEAHPDQSSALRREAAIKTMDRSAKLAMVRRGKILTQRIRQIVRLEDVPNIGDSIAMDLRRLGIKTPAELPGRDPYFLYDELCRITRVRQDPCVLDAFIAAVRFMEGAPKRPWWKYTAERKRDLALRTRTPLEK